MTTDNSPSKLPTLLNLHSGKVHGETKPDGWHTYHICGGLMREIRMVASEGDATVAMCPFCGDWCRTVVAHETRP